MAPSQNSRQTLLENANETTRLDIINCFFGEASKLGSPNLECYFDYYHRELRRLRVGVVPVLSRLAAKTHHDLLDICRVLSAGRSRARSEIRTDLLSHFQTTDHQAVDRSIDLTIRLWLMIDIRDSGYSLWTPSQQALYWEECSSLAGFVSSQFRSSSTELGFRESRLDPEFTVANMVRICGLNVTWTDSINDHLRLDRRKKLLSVFPFKDFLVGHLNYAMTEQHGKSNEHNILSHALLTETITSLNLLFPQWDPLTQSLLREHGQNFDSEAPFEGPSRPNLDEFFFWRDRLLEVYEEIYKAPPGTWVQMWVDRRNPQQWGTFWIASLVLVLTVIGLGTGVVQAWASVKSLELSVKSLELQLASSSRG